jgi:DNA polymerase III gamma/tau subunit
MDISRTASYCVRSSDIDSGVSFVVGNLNEISAPASGDDYRSLQKTTISIDDVRLLQEFHEQTSLSGQKTIVCAGSFITTQAQNALLKMIEEPKEGERIFLVVTHETELIPTILSRVQSHRLQAQSEQGGVESFISMPASKRISFMEENFLSMEESDSKREALLSFLRSLEEYVHGTQKLTEYKDLLQALPTLRQMLGNQGAPAKMIAEYVALAF